MNVISLKNNKKHITKRYRKNRKSITIQYILNKNPGNLSIIIYKIYLFLFF